MKKLIRAAYLALAAGLAFASAAQAAGAVREGTVVDIKPSRIILMDIERAGDRLVTVGERGFALLSDDAGKSWRAVGTPVTRTLTGIAFEDAMLGVAVGHGGSMVRTEDGGATWTVVELQDTESESLLGVASLGGGKFVAYGAFGLYFHSADGGKTWQRRRILAEDFEAHISQVLPTHDALWLVGEAGTIARSEDGGSTYTAVPSPYTGSFFGILTARDGALLIFGMRGNVFRSADDGATWQQIELGGTKAALNGGRVLSDGRIVLVGNSGLVAESADNGLTFKVEWSPAGTGFSALAEGPGGLVVAGASGVAMLDAALLARK